MSFYSLDADTPAEFATAALGLANPKLRSELHTEQIGAPNQIAKCALAFSAHVPDPTDTPLHRGVGRIVFLYDPDQKETWGSNFRVIAYGKSPLESEMLSEQGESANYSWEILMRALAKSGAKYSHEAGTITQMISTGMGSLANDQSSTELELRATWSPEDGDFAPHFAAWQDLIAGMANYAVEAEDVINLARSK